MELPVEQQFTNERSKDYRGYKIVSTDPFGFWHIQHPDGNRLPDELKEGQFTEYPLAQRKIDQYLAKKELEANKPPLDKNTRKVQEVLKGKE